MIRKFIFYFAGSIILAFFAAGIASFALHYVPYALLAVVLVAPIYGAIRMQKNWKKGMASLFKVFRIHKMSVSSLLVVGIVILMLYKVILITLAMGLLTCIGGAATIFLLWECVRFALSKWKSIRIVSFAQAFKNAW